MMSSEIASPPRSKCGQAFPDHPLGRLLEQFPPDQHAADLAGSGADLVELCVAQEPARGIVVDIAVAAEQLDRIERDLCRLLRGIEDRTRRVLTRGCAPV